MTALLVTWAVEAVILVALFRERRGSALLAATLLNGLTNPLANWAFVELGWSFLVLEALVVAVEAALLVPLLELDVRRALRVALAINAPTAAASFLF